MIIMSSYNSTNDTLLSSSLPTSRIQCSSPVNNGTRRRRSVSMDVINRDEKEHSRVRRLVDLQTQRRRSIFADDPPSLKFGLDIGGTLSKLVFFEPKVSNTTDVKNRERVVRAVEFLTSSDTYGESGVRDREYDFELSTGVFHFVKFATADLADVLEVGAQLEVLDSDDTLYCTGGGAFKFEQLLKDKLGVSLLKLDELDTLVHGVNYLLFEREDQAYEFEHFLFHEDVSIVPCPPPTTPYLIVNIGSGVSIINVTDQHTFSRVGGTNLGGGTFLGMARALSGGQICTWADALKLAEEGKSTNVDMLVQDIYGGNYESLGLAGTHVASSFGKLVRNDVVENQDYDLKDMVRSTLLMLTNNIGSLAILQAQLHHAKCIYFTGNFLKGNEFSKRTLAYAVNFWSKGKVQARFLRREGYFGALGTLLSRT